MPDLIKTLAVYSFITTHTGVNLEMKKISVQHRIHFIPPPQHIRNHSLSRLVFIKQTNKLLTASLHTHVYMMLMWVVT